jgi:heptose I phosphotransferase
VGLRRLLAMFNSNAIVSQGRKEFENICEFRKVGLPTVNPVAMGERFFRFFWVESFLITEDFHPYISLETMLENQPEFFAGPERKQRRRALIKEISSHARKMHTSGFNHRDFNATHILTYYDKGSDTPKLALFDLQRVDKRKSFRFRWMIKSLARVNYTLPESLFDEEDRVHLLLNYKGKRKLQVFDRLQWFYIRRKTARIKRHTNKIRARG